MQTFEEMLDEWQEHVKQAAHHKEEELRLRKLLFNGAFPNPTEGANVRELADGREVVGTHKISRTIDDAGLAVAQAYLRTVNVPEAALVFTSKWSFAVGPYRKLEEKHRTEVDRTLVIKPGAPALAVR